jgi:hypothetical protein
VTRREAAIIAAAIGLLAAEAEQAAQQRCDGALGRFGAAGQPRSWIDAARFEAFGSDADGV